MQISASLLAAQVNYSLWASRKLLTYALTLPEEDVLKEAGNSHGGILQTFQHTYYADRAWINRFEGTGVGFLDPPPGPSLADLDRDWWPTLERFEANVRVGDPLGVLHYRNLKGVPFERPNWQVILHVVNHGTYHRGQIVTMMRQLGHHPPSTDLIYYYLEQ